VKLAIVDPKLKRPVMAGHVGEIWVAGPGVAKGYQNRQRESSRTFGALLADRPGTTFLRTGDLGFVADGHLFVVGRLHDMIVVRGRNLYPGDIETTVIAACARWEATGCAVFAADDAAIGRAQGVIVALELPRRADDALHSEIAERVRERVAAVHGVTVSSVVAIERRLLPRTSSGKLRRSECARQHRMGILGSASRRDIASNSV
jgi:acyl-CoA synthetase (AMP-forming)/AMP-acid ligase II